MKQELILGLLEDRKKFVDLFFKEKLDGRRTYKIIRCINVCLSTLTGLKGPEFHVWLKSQVDIKQP